MKPKVGLMLGGGGAKGGYQVGVIRALQDAKLVDNIDVIAGTSIGAINGLLLASLESTDKLSEVWRYAQSKNIYKQGFTRLKTDREGLYSLDVLRDVFNHYIDPKKIRNAKIDLYAVAAKIIDPKKIASQIRKDNHEKVVFHVNKHQTPFEPVIASASIPLFFGTTYIDNEPYVDGGVIDNNPIDVLVDQGCDIILAVPLDYNFDVRPYTNRNILIVNLTDLSVFSSKPIQDAYDIIRFTEDALTERQNYGYLAAKEVIQKLRTLGFLKKGMFGLNENFRSPERFTYVDVPMDTYDKIKASNQERHIPRRESKKRASIQHKIIERISRGNKDGNS